MVNKAYLWLRVLDVHTTFPDLFPMFIISINTNLCNLTKNSYVKHDRLQRERDKPMIMGERDREHERERATLLLG